MNGIRARGRKVICISVDVWPALVGGLVLFCVVLTESAITRAATVGSMIPRYELKGPLTLSNEKAEPPEIKLVVPLTPVQHLACSVTAVNYPGSELLIRGKNFGNEPGWVRIIGQFPTGIRMTLQILSWADNEIRAKIPIMKGVVDQTIRLQVGGGKMSNEWPIPFTSLRERALLPGRLGRVIFCAGSRNLNTIYNQCRWRDAQPISAIHMQLGTSNRRSGSDTYWVGGELQNGWRIESFEWVRTIGVRPPLTFVPEFKACDAEKFYFYFSVDWDAMFTSGTNTANYSLKVNIAGPIGMPY